MKKITAIILSGTAILFLSACGSSGGSSSSTPVDPAPPPLDNSILSDGASDYGYFGTDVIYGNTIAAGEWTMSGGNSPINFELDADGTLLLDTAIGVFPFSYGISADGKVLSHSLGDEKWEITQTLNNDCYNIENYTDGQILDRTLCKR